jgi:hypothetical protein
MVIALSVGSTAAITSYQTLADAVASHMQRSDIGDSIGRFVQLVEAYLKREVRTLDMETETELTAAASVALPDDLLSIRSLTVQGDQATAIPDRTLRGVSPSRVAAEFSGAEGPPFVYTRIGNTIRLTPPPSDDEDAEEITLSLLYLAKFTPLTATSTTNWILNDHPDVYFYGILAHAYAWIEDPANAASYAGLFVNTVEEMRASRARDRWGSGVAMPTSVSQVAGARC